MALGSVKRNPKNLTAEDVGALPVTKYKTTTIALDDLVEEGRYFVMNKADCPNNSYVHAFIEVTYYNGDVFSPSASLGKTKCVKQTYYGIMGASVPTNSIMNTPKYRYGIKGENAHDKYQWTDWTTGFLPLTGETLSGDVAISKNTPTFDLLCASERALRIRCAEDGVAWLNAKKQDSSGYTSLQIHPETASKENLITLSTYIDNVSTNYKVFGSHNKPSGTYTGNGDATARTIDTGGIGQVVLIYSNTFGSVILTYVNGISWLAADGVQVISQENGYFRNGIITLKTTLKYLNQSGITYHYRVL